MNARTAWSAAAPQFVSGCGVLGRTKGMMRMGFPHQFVWHAVLLLSLMTLQLIHAQDSNCGSKTSCGECIQVPDCKWCSKLKNDTSSKVKCFASSRNMSDICHSVSPEYIENPLPSKNNTKDEPLTEDNSNYDGRPIQLRPQEVKLSLRKGLVYSLDVKYVQAEDYPVDLYYLMDLSNSMKDDKENVARLGKKIAVELRKHTRLVRLGFGSFIDKVSLPFVDMQKNKLENPCTQDNPCAPPYSFKNDLPLTDDIDAFETGVDEAKISGNIDSPEGGFDALMQVMKCKQQIRWDDNVRKIVVFSTDASFHFAGDGKLAGVVIPNDEKCHLDKSTPQEYTQFLEYDYPSVSQINKVAKEENINIIFAIAGTKHKELYRELSSEIEASTMGILDKGSSNIVNLVVKQYLAIKSTIEIKDNTEELNGQLALEVWLKCPGDKEHKKKKSCYNLDMGSKVDLRLDITLLSCPDVEISEPIELIVETSQDTIKILVERLCQCGCDSPGHHLNNENTDKCGIGGNLTCGVCNCAPNFYGQNCQCEKGQKKGSDEDKKNCRKDGDEDALECSGNGHCSCGLCECKNEFFSGSLCECNRRQCFSDTSQGEVCSGHGTCDCEKCICYPGRIGNTCECPDNSTCKAKGEDVLCSGEGDCVCGVCKCHSNSNRFGQFCEGCPTCVGGLCEEYRDCAQFEGFGTGRLSQQEFERNCSSLEIKKDDDLTSEQNQGGIKCTFTDEDDDCLFSFTYRYIPTDEKQYIITVQRLKDCPEPPNILAITISVIAAIVAVGLLTLLIWKLLTTLHDKREYAKFSEDMANSKWQTDNNPIYHPATTTIVNPAFKQ